MLDSAVHIVSIVRPYDAAANLWCGEYETDVLLMWTMLLDQSWISKHRGAPLKETWVMPRVFKRGIAAHATIVCSEA